MSEEHNHNCIEFDDLMNNIKINIEKYGLQVIIIEETDYLPSFAYSIGLWQKYNHPEIICFGLSTSLLHEIINDVAEIVKQNEKITEKKNYSNIFEDSRCEFLKVHPENIQDYFGSAINYYESESFTALQLVWTDRNDKFPWQENFEEDFLYKQPLLDRNIDFKFYEPKNLSAFTTRQWLDTEKPIIRVVHDEDGDWQFLTDDEISTENIIIVALEQIILKDKTLNKLFDLNYGEEAERKFIGDTWVRNKIEYDNEE